MYNITITAKGNPALSDREKDDIATYLDETWGLSEIDVKQDEEVTK